MATILLDSSVIFDALNGKRGRKEFLAQLLQQGNILACCPVNLTEVYAGLRDHEKPHTEAFLRKLKFYPITPDIAREAGLLKRNWRQKGHTLSHMDVTLAAIAIHSKLVFLTDNVKHFPMPELHLLPLPGQPPLKAQR
jgi:predicted nucleic acid-binding protein